MNFVILVYMLYHVQMYLALKLQASEKRLKIVDLASCRICYEMFSFEFDYDQFQSANAEKDISNHLNWLRSDPRIMGNESVNVLALAQEIAMKYFLKSGEIQFNESKKLTCSKFSIGENSDCDKLKLGTCTLVLSSNLNCSDQIEDLFHKEPNQSIKKASNESELNTNSYNYSSQLTQTSERPSNQSLNRKLVNSESTNIEKNLLNLSKMLNLETDQLVNGQNLLPKSSNQNIKTDIQNYPKHQEMPISLIEIAPEVKEYDITKLQNDQNTSSSQKLNSASWSPPRPALFDNFQDNLGNQLKEISFLTK